MNDDHGARGRRGGVLGRCLELFQEGRIREADRLAGEALATSPDDGDLWQMRGLLRQRLGDTEGARSALEEAGLLVPLAAPARCVLADCYARAGRVELALGLYRHLAADPACPADLLPMVASGLGSLGDDGAALATCRELIRRDPSRHEAHFGVAFYLRRLGNPPEAVLPAVARADELAPAIPLYRVALAALLSRRGAHDEAYELLRGVDPRSISCGGCLSRMMSTFLLAGDLPRADTCRARAERVAAGEGRPLPPPSIGPR